jgi:Domain of unknown function (DUF1707)
MAQEGPAMANDHMIRASDLDREAVVAVLRDAYAAGRLDAEEFDERTTAAYAGRTWGELRKLTEDLPEQPALGADLPAQRPPAITPAQAGPPRNGGAGRRPFVPVFPIFAIWFLITVAAHSPAAAPVAVVALVMMMVFLSSGRRRRHGGTPGNRDGRGPGDNHDAL